jgi:DNA-binding Lrp family transcriptional regulator
MGSVSLDDVDRAILHHLQENARKSLTDIAEAVNVSDNTVRNRVQNLEENGVIQGYRIDVDYDAADIQHHYLFVCTVRVRRREELARKAREHDGVTEVISLMTGRCNVYVIGVGEGKDDMTDLAYDLDGLGLEIEREHLIRDHARQSFDGFRLPENL